jgi:hypothetical protein
MSFDAIRPPIRPTQEETMITPEETAAKEETATTCFICHKDLSGMPVPTSKLTIFTDALVANKIATVGVACDHCDTRYCENHKKELHNALLWGFQKSTCLKCGEIIGGSRTIVQLRSAKDYSEVPEIRRALAEAKLELAQPGAIGAPAGGTAAQASYPADVCPMCGGNKITQTKVPVGSIKDRLFELIFGGGLLLLLVVGARLGARLEISANVMGVLVAIGLWMALEMFWEGLTNHPLPILGLRLFGTKVEARATCEACKFSWKVSKEAAA